MNVTESGMAIEEREAHSENASELIKVTESGMVIEEREVHS